MNSQVRIRRSRGAVSGAALILLGLWGGLAPFIGHYLHFGFTPDKAWSSTNGRLYLSAVPGGAAVLGGLAVILTRSRVVGIVGSLLAALGGAWFIAGTGLTTYVLKLTGINAGSPLGYSGSGSYTVHAYAEVLALFTGLGALILFFAALACGRVSLLSARDAADAADTAFYPDYQAASASVPEQASYPTVGRFPEPAADPFAEPATGQFPTAAGKFPPVSEQFTQPSSLPPNSSPFGEAPNPFSPETPAP
jgi:hypothetical protein